GNIRLCLSVAGRRTEKMDNLMLLWNDGSCSVEEQEEGTWSLLLVFCARAPFFCARDSFFCVGSAHEHFVLLSVGLCLVLSFFAECFR
ncbi:MAG: hypothetical protein ACX936_21535, partial [Marinobacter sp.]